MKQEKYVAISDLVMNGGDGCTLLYRVPAADHIVVVEDDTDAAHLGSIMITYKGDTLLWRTMKDSILEDEQRLSVGDLQDSRRILCRDRLNCWKCKHFDFGICWAHGDTWVNFKKGVCPNKAEE